MICKKKVMQLYRRGKTYKEIARELNCSSKQVGRLVRHELVDLDKEFHRRGRRKEEGALWYVLACKGVILNEIADYVGVSTQYVHEQITPYLK